MSEENLALMMKAIGAFNRVAANTDEPDLEAIQEWLDAMDPEIRFEPQQAALEGAYLGREGAGQWLADLQAHYGSGRVELAETHDCGGRVLGLGTIHIVGRGSRIETDVPAALLMTFHDGLITRFQDFGADRDGARKAAGLF